MSRIQYKASSLLYIYKGLPDDSFPHSRVVLFEAGRPYATGAMKEVTKVSYSAPNIHQQKTAAPAWQSLTAVVFARHSTNDSKSLGTILRQRLCV